MQRLVRVIGLCFLVALISQPILSAPIQPDRPGFSTGTYTVRPGTVQLELGFQSSYGNNTEDPDTFTVPLLNVRVGLSSKTELNILMDGWSREKNSNGDKMTSASDILAGAKHQLITREKYNVSLLGFIALRMGSMADSGSFSPFLGVLWDYNLKSDLGVFGTLQALSFVENSQRFTNFQPAVGLTFSHSNSVTTYIEYYKDISLAFNRPNVDMFDAGVAYLFTNDIQLDVNFGVSLDRKSDDFIGAGVAVRF